MRIEQDGRKELLGVGLQRSLRHRFAAYFGDIGGAVTNP
jgi:hypothetical protein